jgi:hypothetical protein
LVGSLQALVIIGVDKVKAVWYSQDSFNFKTSVSVSRVRFQVPVVWFLPTMCLLCSPHQYVFECRLVSWCPPRACGLRFLSPAIGLGFDSLWCVSPILSMPSSRSPSVVLFLQLPVFDDYIRPVYLLCVCVSPVEYTCRLVVLLF